jgi:hypothetical protein
MIIDTHGAAILSCGHLLEANMAATCDLCRQPKPDVLKRPLLRVLDQAGTRTVNPFKGLLCDNCVEKAQRFGSPEHRWVLQQISQTSPKAGRASALSNID